MGIEFQVESNFVRIFRLCFIVLELQLLLRSQKTFRLTRPHKCFVLSLETSGMFTLSLMLWKFTMICLAANPLGAFCDRLSVGKHFTRVYIMKPPASLEKADGFVEPAGNSFDQSVTANRSMITLESFSISS